MGNHLSILAGFFSGVVSSVIFVPLLIFYFSLHPNAIDVDLGNTVLSYLYDDPTWFYAVCLFGYLAVGMVLASGVSIGWLFVRPMGNLLTELWPASNNVLFAWSISGVFTWMIIGCLITLPLWYENTINIISLSGIVSISLLSGSIGGLLGGRRMARGGDFRYALNGRSRVGVGGIISGGVYSFLSLSVSLTVTLNELGLVELSKEVSRFYFQLGIFIMFALLLNVVVWFPATLLTRLYFLRDHIVSVWVVVGALVWMFLMGAFYQTSGNVPLLMNVSNLIVSAIAGACGGWVTGQFKRSD